MRFRLCLVVAYVFFSSILEVTAASSQGTETNVSTFVYPTGDGNLTFALTATNGGDVYMHLSAPATYQWVGIGTGSKMEGSVMFIVYENADKLSATLSPRLSDGHSEPTYSSSVDCDLFNQTSDHGGIVQKGSSRYYSVNIHCKNITAHGEGDGKLDFSNTKQPFIYAWGPTDGAVSSASKSASIKRHDSYGTLWMDLAKATSSNSDINATFTEAALLTTQNAGADGQAQSDGDKVGPAHAVIMLVTFVIIFPLGALLLRFLESVKAHYIVQTVGLLAAVVGIAVGLYLGTMYNHSKDVSSGHQVFGLILLILLLAQWAIGLYHHLRFRKYKRPTIYGRVHLFAGPAIVLGGIINGFTGFNFSGDSHNNVYYGAVVAVVIIVVLALLGWKRWSKNKQAKHSRMLDDEELHEGSYQMNASHGASY
ncbi:hypothetical protein E8E13_002638 [Curvularia kusanoi]|uniref:Cytochrome b561 domain-containing protein n=1 Tax=Curvularia kusanoi TaxID=90978 RepID=A0A9P4T4U7_CURKU|nr:hypothetical protein E8E13_002638 [Curvularia kusanoi]